MRSWWSIFGPLAVTTEIKHAIDDDSFWRSCKIFLFENQNVRVVIMRKTERLKWLSLHWSKYREFSIYTKLRQINDRNNWYVLLGYKTELYSSYSWQKVLLVVVKFNRKCYFQMSTLTTERNVIHIWLYRRETL